MIRAEKSLTGLTKNFEGVSIHKNYLNGLDEEEFLSGMEALAQAFESLYAGMINEPQAYAMKDADDIKGLVKNMNFLLLAAQKGVLRNGTLEIDGSALAPALKEAKVTKPEQYFKILEPQGFVTTGLAKKVEASEKITVDYPDSPHLLTALKAMADAVGAFSGINPNQGSIYFEMLDHRVLANHPATEPKASMEFILSKMRSDSRDVVEVFYEFIKPLAKCELKGGFGHYWTPTFTLKSNKKVILSFKLTLDNHDVKLNLANLGKYTEALDGFPEKLIGTIKDGGWGCGGCRAKSDDCAFSFDLDGQSYRKCRCGSFVFDKPDQNDTELLLKLLKKELEFA